MGQTAIYRITTFAIAALLSGRALAQTAPPEEADAADASDLPEVKDPMLEPVPPAPNVLSSWKDVVRFIHQRSTTFHIAAAGVEQANGEARSALAASLPVISANSTLTHHLLHGTGERGLADRMTTVPVRIPNPDGVIIGSIDLRQPIFNLGAWYARVPLSSY